MAEDAPRHHRSYAPEALCCLVLAAGARGDADAESAARAVRERLAAEGHRVRTRSVPGDGAEAIRAAVAAALAEPGLDALLLTGAPEDGPADGAEAVAGLLERRLEGFGELFRVLRFEAVGAAAMRSRALAGAAGRVAVFVLPGSAEGARLAVERLVAPELPHLVGQLRRSAARGGG